MEGINIKKTYDETEEDNIKKLLEVFEIIFNSISGSAGNKE